MTSRTLPGIGLKGFWALGEDGWKDGMDQNLLKLSTLLNFKILDRVATLPGSPSEGDIYIVTSGAEAQNIAVRDNGAWVYYTPEKGWRYHDVAADKIIVFDGTEWVEEGSGGASGGALLNIQVFESDGTYDKTVNNPSYVIVEMVGGGGGGGGRAGSGSSEGGDGGTSSFGSHCSATGGRGAGEAPAPGGLGGGATGGDLNSEGEPGGTSQDLYVAGSGGSGFFGGGGRGWSGGSLWARSGGGPGSGGGGGTPGTASKAAGGGGAGGYSIKRIDANLLGSTETVTVGSGGNRGGSQTGDGRNGADGVVIVWEYA